MVCLPELNALMPDSLDGVMQVLFWKIPRYIGDMVNPKDYKTLTDLTQRCNEIWKNCSPDASAMAAAAVQL